MTSMTQGDISQMREMSFFEIIGDSLRAKLVLTAPFVAPLAYLTYLNEFNFTMTENLLLGGYLFTLICFFSSISGVVRNQKELNNYRTHDHKRWEGWGIGKVLYIDKNYRERSIKEMAEDLGHSEASVRGFLVKNHLYEHHLTCRVMEGAQRFFEARKITEEKGITVKWTEDLEGLAELLEYQMPIKADWPLVEQLIRTQKDSRVEFVETCFNDTASGKSDEAVKHQFLMHVAAFLNTAGGQVVIGVKDDGAIGGLKIDGYSSGYTYEKKVKTLIEQTLGEDVSKYLDIKCVDAIYKNRSHKNFHKQVCLVTCIKAVEVVQCVHRRFNVYNGYDKLEPLKYLRVGSATRLSAAKKPPYLRVV